MSALNTLAANRRMAWIGLRYQLLVTIVVALVFGFLGLKEALAVFVGGGAVVAGGAVFAWRALLMSAPSAGSALAGFLLGTLIKWSVTLMALFLALAHFGLPALPLLAGVASASIAFLFVGITKS